jgi:uncharacterized protein YjbJ (UPF0337 family)
MQRNLVFVQPFNLHQPMEARMDKDRVEGAAKNLGGKVKEAAGKVTGDEKLKREGQADQVVGKVQNTVGGVKDKLRENDREERRDERKQ